MDDNEDDAHYPPDPPSSYHHPSFRHAFSSSHRPKLPVRNPSSVPAQVSSNFFNGDRGYDDDGDAAEDDEEDDMDDDAGEEEENAGDGLEEEDDDAYKNDELGYARVDSDVDLEARGQKRRRLEKLAQGYEFSSRLPSSKPATGGGTSTSPPDWSERETFALLDAWGDRFLQLGRKSLRKDEWNEVVKRVSKVSRTNRTDSQCRNRLDTLKKKYKKEQTKLAETGIPNSKWIYFEKMDVLMSPLPKQSGLACGLDSGEYVITRPRGCFNHSNGLDVMRDSPGNSESVEADDDEDEESEGLPPNRSRDRKMAEENEGVSSSFMLLAESIQKFGEIYEKIEVNKRQQMMELEKMRIDFHRDLELQKRRILEQVQSEITKIRQEDDEEMEVSVENGSG